MSTLQLSIHGPFLYHFTRGQVELHAAKCAGHTAGFFTAKNEVPLTGRHRHGNSRCYRIMGPVFTPPNPLSPLRFHDPDNTILNAFSAAKPDWHKSHFCLILPLPQLVVPLIPYDVEVIDSSTNPSGKPTGKLKRHAAGLRFYYEADLSQNLMLTLDDSPVPAWIADFDAADLGHPFADAEIRYTSVTPELQEHQDALECFDSLASLAGVDWWLSFDDPSKPHGVQPFAKTGADCRAPILIIHETSKANS